MSGPRRPTAFRVEDAEPSATPPPFETGPEEAFAEAETGGDLVPRDDPAAGVRRRGWSLGTIFTVGLGGLVSLGVGFAIDRLIADLFDRAPWLGWVALVLAAMAAVGALGLVIKEVVALRKIAKIENLRLDGQGAADADDREAALKVCRQLSALYSARASTARGRAALAAHMDEIIDGRDLIGLAEREVLSPIDAQARAMVMASAKRVSVVTALSPRALVDILYVAVEAFRLMRRLAALYAGRPGTLGFLRLARHTIQHLAVTGGMAAGDSLLHEVVGGSVVSRLSTRMGEGVVNGLMTARLGLAAIDVCRPLPFVKTRRPRVSDIVSELGSFAGEEAKGKK
ncbi:YcjF family protein [Amorphus orientalis]|uniref:Membrane protein n=1 Tax=Amorphus orientalis TaxID=649198 RepID=A0AAE3VRP2_9HYPH|nr:TIGR01620 family protein [Amorphus orientalis]MDQ0317529.1 putative membrane protein [Amorphus orientalis]